MVMDWTSSLVYYTVLSMWNRPNVEGPFFFTLPGDQTYNILHSIDGECVIRGSKEDEPFVIYVQEFEFNEELNVTGIWFD